MITFLLRLLRDIGIISNSWLERWEARNMSMRDRLRYDQGQEAQDEHGAAVSYADLQTALDGLVDALAQQQDLVATQNAALDEALIEQDRWEGTDAEQYAAATERVNSLSESMVGMQSSLKMLQDRVASATANNKQSERTVFQMAQLRRQHLMEDEAVIVQANANDIQERYNRVLEQMLGYTEKRRVGGFREEAKRQETERSRRLGHQADIYARLMGEHQIQGAAVSSAQLSSKARNIAEERRAALGLKKVQLAVAPPTETTEEATKARKASATGS